jgi:hypothetical protein
MTFQSTEVHVIRWDFTCDKCGKTALLETDPEDTNDLSSPPAPDGWIVVPTGSAKDGWLAFHTRKCAYGWYHAFVEKSFGPAPRSRSRKAEASSTALALDGGDAAGPTAVRPS